MYLVGGVDHVKFTLKLIRGLEDAGSFSNGRNFLEKFA